MTTHADTMTRRRTKRRGLPRIIGANGWFSLVSGLVALAGALVLDGWFELPAWVIAATGAGLILYGALLRSAARRDPLDRRMAWLATGADLAWIAMATVLVAVPHTMTGRGKWTLVALTLAVLDFAVLQIVQLRRPASDV